MIANPDKFQAIVHNKMDSPVSHRLDMYDYDPEAAWHWSRPSTKI